MQGKGRGVLSSEFKPVNDFHHKSNNLILQPAIGK